MHGKTKFHTSDQVWGFSYHSQAMIDVCQNWNSKAKGMSFSHQTSDSKHSEWTKASSWGNTKIHNQQNKKAAKYVVSSKLSPIPTSAKSIFSLLDHLWNLISTPIRLWVDLEQKAFFHFLTRGLSYFRAPRNQNEIQKLMVTWESLLEDVPRSFLEDVAQSSFCKHTMEWYAWKRCSQVFERYLVFFWKLVNSLKQGITSS